MESGALLQTAAAPPPSPVATTQRPARARTARGADAAGGRVQELPNSIGRFVVLRKIGEGGMGVVVAAFDEALDRKLAIKLRHGQLGGDDDTVKARMLREAQAMARLSHPNVVQVYEVGEHEGQLYVAMEFVRGQTLREWQGAEPRGWGVTVAMYMQAAQGLAAAHAAGIVHRDFKPENVLVGADGRARVLDFGLARDAGGREAARGAEAAGERRALSLTQSGALMGTPAYMSPEQFLGEATGPASDQFSFCVALHEGLFGDLPFAGETWQELAANVTGGEMRPAPASSEVPESLRLALRRGLATLAKDRHPSMEALLAELAAHVELDGTPRRPRSRRWWPALGLGGLLAVSGPALVVLLASEPPPPPTAPAEDVVEVLSERARGAAARLRWVFPAREDPDDTAYLRVLELEHLGTEAAGARARALRREFSDALRSLGDRFWDIEGGKAFARDFYIQAALFTPEDVELSDRSGRTTGELADLRARAVAGNFTESELRSGKIVVALAEPDDLLAAAELADIEVEEPEPEVRRADALRRVRQRGAPEPRPRPAADREPRVAEPAGASPTPPSPSPAPSPAPPLELPLEPAPIEASRPPATAEPERPRPAKPEVDPDRGPGRPTPADVARAAELVRAARAALEGGAAGEGERLYRQALDLDPDNTDALIGLSDLYFERSVYARALTFAQRAVRLAPKNAGYRLRLGDAYFKSMRYTQARQHYETARELGEPLADGRLARLEELVGQ